MKRFPYASMYSFFAALLAIGCICSSYSCSSFCFKGVIFAFRYKYRLALKLRKNYKPDVYNDLDRYGPITSQSYQQQICADFPVISRRPNSKANDYLVGAVFKDPSNLLPFIGTLRRTGCKATVVCLCDDFANYKLFKAKESDKNKEVIELFQKLGGYIINIGFVTTYGRVSSFFSKVLVCYDFIKLYSKFIDRVMIIDILDIIFQGDPFTEEIVKNKVTFFSEFADFGKEIFWTGIVYKMKNVNMSKILNKPIINGGTYASDSKTMLKFLDVFFNTVGNDLVLIDFDDQAFINYVVYMGILQENGIDYRIITEPEGYVIIYSTFGVVNRLKSYKIGEIKSTNAILPSLIVHQFERSCKISKHLREICPKPKNTSWLFFFRRNLILDNDEKCDLEWD